MYKKDNTIKWLKPP